VKEGTLKRGDVVLAGAAYGKVRAMHDWAGRTLKKVGPSEPAAVIGLSEVPRAGDQVYVVKDLKTAQGIAETRKVKERRSLAPSVGNKPRTLEEIAQLMSETEQLELKVIVKADVGGSAEAVSESLVQLSTEKVRVSVVLSAAGAITENDVNLAVAANAIIVGFNVKPAGKSAALAQREGIEIRQYSIIYNVLDDVKLAMEGLLAPKLVERELGMAEVRQTFRISKTGTIAGSMVTKGSIRRGAGARLIREGETIWEGKVSGLKRFNEDVKEVKDGFECGISLENYNEIHVGDISEVFERESIKQSL
jgi:translation initiation factor IF-2